MDKIWVEIARKIRDADFRGGGGNSDFGKPPMREGVKKGRIFADVLRGT